MGANRNFNHGFFGIIGFDDQCCFKDGLLIRRCECEQDFYLTGVAAGDIGLGDDLDTGWDVGQIRFVCTSQAQNHRYRREYQKDYVTPLRQLSLLVHAEAYKGG
ncbi:MAG: hypothetical protein HOK97_21835 [Deltaproteobacteria bacterium]|nr:hypothetical protein [Deltaproteobacteria bacterium]